MSPPQRSYGVGPLQTEGHSNDAAMLLSRAVDADPDGPLAADAALRLCDLHLAAGDVLAALRRCTAAQAHFERCAWIRLPSVSCVQADAERCGGDRHTSKWVPSHFRWHHSPPPPCRLQQVDAAHSDTLATLHLRLSLRAFGK